MSTFPTLKEIEDLLDRKLEEKLEQKLDQKFKQELKPIHQAIISLNTQVRRLNQRQSRTERRLTRVEHEVKSGFQKVNKHLTKHDHEFTSMNKSINIIFNHISPKSY